VLVRVAAAPPSPPSPSLPPLLPPPPPPPLLTPPLRPLLLLLPVRWCTVHTAPTRGRRAAREPPQWTQLQAIGADTNRHGHSALFEVLRVLMGADAKPTPFFGMRAVLSCHCCSTRLCCSAGKLSALPLSPGESSAQGTFPLSWSRALCVLWKWAGVTGVHHAHQIEVGVSCTYGDVLVSGPYVCF
jgi:hypothetical protein